MSSKRTMKDVIRDFDLCTAMKAEACDSYNRANTLLVGGYQEAAWGRQERARVVVISAVDWERDLALEMALIDRPELAPMPAYAVRLPEAMMVPSALSALSLEA